MSATDAYRLSVIQVTHKSQGCCAKKTCGNAVPTRSNLTSPLI